MNVIHPESHRKWFDITGRMFKLLCCGSLQLTIVKDKTFKVIDQTRRPPLVTRGRAKAMATDEVHFNLIVKLTFVVQT